MITQDLVRQTVKLGRSIRKLEETEYQPGIPWYMKGRITYSPTLPVPITDLTSTSAQTLYFMPVEGGFDTISFPYSSTITGDTTNGSAVITDCSDTTGLVAGMGITGTGIPGATTILSIDSATQITLSANATADGNDIVLTYTLQASTNFDVLLNTNEGYLSLLPWTNATTRATALARVDGIDHISGFQAARYLGSVRTVAAGQGADALQRRFLWNKYNRVVYRDLSKDTTDTWTYNVVGTWAAMNTGNAAWKHEFIVGIQEYQMGCEINSIGYNGAFSSIALDSTTTPATRSSRAGWGNAAPGQWSNMWADYTGIGYHYLQALNTISAAGPITFLGDGGGIYWQSTMKVTGER